MTITAQNGEVAISPQYAKYEQGTVTPQKAYGRVTLNAIPSINDTVTIGAIVYRFVTSPAAADDVKIDATLLAIANNLLAAITAGTGIGTLYGTGTTANASVTADVSVLSPVVFLTAAVAGHTGNSIALATSNTTNITVSASTLIGGLTGGAYEVGQLNWLRMRAEDIKYGVEQAQSLIPLEIGGVLTPTGAYKSHVSAGGELTVMPRMQNSMGWLLLAALGNATTSVVGAVATHTFRYDSNQQYLPWFAVRKMIPGDGKYVQPEGLLVYDNKLQTMKMTVAQGGPIRTEVGFMGRFPSLDNHPDVWPGSTFEDYTTIPLACKGFFKLPTRFPNPLPITQLVIDIENQLTTGKEETIVGSYYDDDLAVLTRRIGIRFVYKWNSPDLYQIGFGGAVKATAWNPAPFVETFDGTNYAFEAMVQPPFNIPTTTTPYSLDIKATTCQFQPMGDPRMQAGNVIMQEWMGTVLAPTSGDYATFTLVNGQTSGYPMPTEV